MTQWQPIETIPYEVNVLVYSPTDGCVYVAQRDPILGIYDGHHDITDYEEITHWMPLPEPPKTRAQVEDELTEEGYAWQ
jgi:hypothetical protein